MLKMNSIISLSLFFLVFLANWPNTDANIKPKPWQPVAKADARWVYLHQLFLNQTRTLGKQIKLVFFGDSITEGWSSHGKIVWQQYYGNRSSVNYGISRDRTDQLVYRLLNGEFEGLDPKVVVMMIGTNNLNRSPDNPQGYDIPEDIAKGIEFIVNGLQKKLPKTKVLLLGVIPRSSAKALINKVNRIIEKLDNNSTVRFLNMRYSFEDNNGGLKPGLYTDGLHLTEAGHRAWAQTMEPLLKKMLGES